MSYGFRVMIIKYILTRCRQIRKKNGIKIKLTILWVFDKT